jgi:hypothetical protein
MGSATTGGTTTTGEGDTGMRTFSSVPGESGEAVVRTFRSASGEGGDSDDRRIAPHPDEGVPEEAGYGYGV